MKNITILLALTMAFTSSAMAQLRFDGSNYTEKWHATEGGATMKEYYTDADTTQNWSTMLTIQSHPSAHKVSEVCGPYYEARKSIVAQQPNAHAKTEGDPKDVVLELFLGAPGVTPHLEFALARFIETEKGVFVIVYSHKVPFQGTARNQNVDVSEIMKKKDGWLKELFDIPVEIIELGGRVHLLSFFAQPYHAPPAKKDKNTPKGPWCPLGLLTFG